MGRKGSPGATGPAHREIFSETAPPRLSVLDSCRHSNPGPQARVGALAYVAQAVAGMGAAPICWSRCSMSMYSRSA